MQATPSYLESERGSREASWGTTWTTWTTGAATTAIVVGDAASLVIVGGLVAGAGDVSSGVDKDGLPREEAVVKVVAETDVVDEGVVVNCGLADADAVGRVEGQGLRVGGVGLNGLGLVDEILVEEELADVRGDATGGNVGVVGEKSCSRGRHQVDVGRASGVVAGENGVELDDSVFIGALDTTTVGAVQTALASRGNARVHTRGVASPL